jgi:hypothetical protein
MSPLLIAENPNTHAELEIVDAEFERKMGWD